MAWVQILPIHMAPIKLKLIIEQTMTKYFLSNIRGAKEINIKRNMVTPAHLSSYSGLMMVWTTFVSLKGSKTSGKS